MGSLDTLINNGLYDEEGLKSEGFKLVGSRDDYGPDEVCYHHVVKSLSKKLNIENVSVKETIKKINTLIFRFRILKTYSDIPFGREASDFIVMYTNFNINHLQYIQPLDERPLDFTLLIPHWAKVERRDGGRIVVSSKIMDRDVYEHDVNNNVLEDFIIREYGGSSYCFIDIRDLENLLVLEI